MVKNKLFDYLAMYFNNTDSLKGLEYEGGDIHILNGIDNNRKKALWVNQVRNISGRIDCLPILIEPEKIPSNHIIWDRLKMHSFSRKIDLIDMIDKNQLSNDELNILLKYKIDVFRLINNKMAFRNE